jgi:hypothetical protein
MLRQQLFFPDQQLAMQFCQQRNPLFLWQLQALSNGNVFRLSFQCKQCADPSDGLTRDLRRGLLRIYELASGMTLRSCARDSVAGHHPVVAAVSVGQQHLHVVFQKFLRAFSTAVQDEVIPNDGTKCKMVLDSCRFRRKCWEALCRL